MSAGIKRKSAGAPSGAGPAKKPDVNNKANHPLWGLRRDHKECSNCGVPAANHNGIMGQKCTAPFKPASDKETALLKK